jgi:molybdopterin adenylyltransferase
MVSVREYKEHNMTEENNNRINNEGVVVATSVATVRGEPRSNLPFITVDKMGVVGDVHAGRGHRQVSLMTVEGVEDFKKRSGKSVNYGFFGENITFSGLDVTQLAVFDRLQINDVLLEITQIGEKCHGDVCDIYRDLGESCLKLQQGLFARIIRVGKGRIVIGDKIVHIPRIFKVMIITLSDRAAAGIYEDKSGEVARQMLAQFFADRHWRWQFEAILLPDDAERLLACLQRAKEEQLDFVFTLGGTGVGMRDIAPETVTQVCDKLMPGIMEHIRLKYGAKNPAALLSRSIAGVTGATQIYTLPGSVRAVSEYLTEIFQTLEHVLLMLCGIDRHK